VNAGYYRADAAALSAETRSYVPRVLELYARLKEQFESGVAPPRETSGGEGRREGRALGIPTSAWPDRAAVAPAAPDHGGTDAAVGAVARARHVRPAR
jgi:hypothetical protein